MSMTPGEEFAAAKERRKIVVFLRVVAALSSALEAAAEEPASAGDVLQRVADAISQERHELVFNNVKDLVRNLT